VPAL